MSDDSSEHTEKAEKKVKRAWYSHGWGIVIVLLIWPFFVLWYVWYRAKWGRPLKLATTAIIAIIFIIAASSQNNASQNVASKSSDTTAKTSSSTTSNQSADSANKQTALNVTLPDNSSSSSTSASPAPAPTPVSTETVSQKNAVGKAKEYLNVEAFSHDGLIDQLEYDQFSAADATYGANNSNADWNQQAAKKAQEYMNTESFSRQGLIDQLEYDKFTSDQAAYGASSVGL